MAVYIDSHVYADVPHAVLVGALDQAERHAASASGACPLDVLLAPPLLWCIIEAPDAVAAMQLHAEAGLRASVLHRIDGAEGASPISDRDRKLILQVITATNQT